MKIHRLSAVFGRLQGETLALTDGLNILQAPNESGKSTWCALLTAMLYGVSSRERDRAGVLAEKNRYAPWDGSSWRASTPRPWRTSLPSSRSISNPING